MKSYIKNNKIYIYSCLLKIYLEYNIDPKKQIKYHKSFKYKCV